MGKESGVANKESEGGRESGSMDEEATERGIYEEQMERLDKFKDNMQGLVEKFRI